MKTQDIAVFVAGAKKPCDICGGSGGSKVPIYDPDTHELVAEESEGCSSCDGMGQVYLLSERARKPCKCFGFYQAGVVGAEWHQSVNGRRGLKRWPDCQGRGWLPAFLLPEELCPTKWTEFPGMMVLPVHPDNCGCGGAGVIQRVDEGLLRELLEAAGYFTEYNSLRWVVYKHSRPFVYNNQTLLEAAATALGVAR